MISILIATYNRSAKLKRAVESVLKQTCKGYELTVIDDCSTDDTAKVMAEYPSVQYIRLPVNLGGQQGDIAIIRYFMDYCAMGDQFMYLCDDDYWIPDDLLERQEALFTGFPSLAFVQGGMVHSYDKPIPLPPPNEPYINYRRAGGDETIFWGGIFPNGFMAGEDYLRLFASDPKNRNIVAGATMFKTSLFAPLLRKSHNIRWQAGYMMMAGMALQGDTYYLDEPCLMVEVGDTASHRRSQYAHMLDSLESVDAAFTGPHPEKQRLCSSIVEMFLLNKLSSKRGGFRNHMMGDMSHVTNDEITAQQFTGLAAQFQFSLRPEQATLINWSDKPDAELEKLDWDIVRRMAK